MFHMTLTIFNLLSILTIIGDVMVLGTLGLLVYAWVSRKPDNRLLAWTGDHGVLFTFIVALIATAGSLFFSEIAHFTPCKLCWFQRIFMYPQVVVLGIALLKKERTIAVMQSLMLSAIGVVFAGYHYNLQMFAKVVKPCSLNDPVSCAEKVVIHYGYITIPMMALTAFLMIIVFLVMVKMRDGKKAENLSTQV
ncbi:MAG: disulfide oxidoreductase [Parcubacteria group bacterium]